MLFSHVTVPSDAECAANRKRAMAEVVRQSRKRKADREAAMVQDDMTALFRKVMCEPAIMQRLQGFLGFQSLVTLLAFTDRNLRLRYATHNPDKYIPLTRDIRAADRVRMRKDASVRIAQERCMFDWKRRLQEHFQTQQKEYGSDTPNFNILRMYLNSVVGAKKTPAISAYSFRCIRCGMFSSDKVAISQLVNKELSPLNCCVSCFLLRGEVYQYKWSHSGTVGKTIREAMIYIVARTLRNDESFLNSLHPDTRMYVRNACKIELGMILRNWPTLKIELRDDLIHNLWERPGVRGYSGTVRFADLQPTCDLLCKVITQRIVYVNHVYGGTLTERGLMSEMAWNKVYKEVGRRHPRFAELFVQPFGK